MELSHGEVTSHRDQISSIGFFSSLEIFLAFKKVKSNVLKLEIRHLTAINYNYMAFDLLVILKKSLSICL